MTFGSLFAGIGGIDLGLERAGMKCVWQVEADRYARQVLETHWPSVQRYGDVRYFLGGKRWRQARVAWEVDLIAGGFPCQDISNAGKRAGIDGSRSGLWSEFARIVRLLRPSYVLVENVPALTLRGLSRVLGDLADLGFDAEWDRIPAAAVGAPHRRWRLFIVAYAQGVQRPQILGGQPDGVGELLVSDSNGQQHQDGPHAGQEDGSAATHLLPHANRRRRQVPQQIQPGQRDADHHSQAALPDPASRWAGQRWREQFAAYCEGTRNLFWPDAQPPVCGVADGVPHRVDKLRGLGNAVVPQIAEWIGRQLIEVVSNSRRCREFEPVRSET